jgi:hypothetical protein
LRQVVAIVLVLFLVATVISFYPAEGMQVNNGTFKVPLVSFISVGFGNEKFQPIEIFHVHHENSKEHRDQKSINLSFSDDFSSSLKDSVLLNYSIHISKAPMVSHFPLQNGTVSITIPSERSYLGTLNLSGSTSFPYAVLVEEVPSVALEIYSTDTSALQKDFPSAIMNFTVQYGNSSFTLYSPRYVEVGNYLSPVSLRINNGSGYSLLSFSFPIKDGNFSFTFNQVMSSKENVNNYVMSYYQLQNFSNPFMTNFLANALSLTIGGAIFVFLIAILFIYYKRK